MIKPITVTVHTELTFSSRDILSPTSPTVALRLDPTAPKLQTP